MFLQKLVEQHRVHCVVAHAINFAIASASHQIGAYLFYILGNQSEADWARRFDLLLVSETHRLEALDYFAAPLHRLDLVLEAL